MSKDACVCVHKHFSETVSFSAFSTCPAYHHLQSENLNIGAE